MSDQQSSPTPQQVADLLIGTAWDFETAVGKPLDKFPLGWLDEFDTHVMCCETCGWWVGSDEIDYDGNCEDCHEES